MLERAQGRFNWADGNAEHIHPVGRLGTAQVTGTRGICCSQAEQAVGRQKQSL